MMDHESCNGSPGFNPYHFKHFDVKTLILKGHSRHFSSTRYNVDSEKRQDFWNLIIILWMLFESRMETLLMGYLCRSISSFFQYLFLTDHQMLAMEHTHTHSWDWLHWFGISIQRPKSKNCYCLDISTVWQDSDLE